MMSHVIMSVFKVASAEANVPGPPPTTASVTSGTSTIKDSHKLVILIIITVLYNCPFIQRYKIHMRK